MEETDIRAPLYYVMGRNLPQADIDAAYCIFTITPCFMGVASKHTDRELIQPFVREMLQAPDETSCRECAAHVARATGRPVLTVGGGRQLLAVYSTGEEEAIWLTS